MRSISKAWNRRYQPFRVSLNFGLNESLYDALSTGDAKRAPERILAPRRGSKGYDLNIADVYSPVVHHSEAR